MPEKGTTMSTSVRDVASPRLAGEACDDGANDRGYGECSPGCKLGEYCGDGIIQENEDCADGNSLDGDDCGSSCRDIIIV